MSRSCIFIIAALLFFSIVEINGGPLKNEAKRKVETLSKVPLVKRDADPVGGHRRKPFGGVRRRPNLGRDRMRQAQRRNRDGSSKRGKREVDSGYNILGMLPNVPVESFLIVHLMKREADPVGGHRRKPFRGVRRRPTLGRDRVREAQRRNRDRSSKRGKRDADSVGGLIYQSRVKRSPEGRGEGGRGRYPKRGNKSNNKSNIFARKKLLNNNRV